MPEFQIIPKSEFDRVASGVTDKYVRLQLFADMCRLNTLVEIKKAGSGHLGSSFSAMDIVTWLYLAEMNTVQLGVGNSNRDVFFSSKGHDVPGLYAVLYALGILPLEKLLNLRRLGGLDGHPDIKIPGMEANSGSLGMGISKARGMAWAKKYRGLKGRVFVMTGDGELQEGQIWESLQTAVHQKSDVTVIVDHNKLQTDMLVDDITSLGRLEEKLHAFGCEVQRCNGHDFRQLEQAFAKLNTVNGKPKVLLADTIKGRGISFMENISATPSPTGKYAWHSGAPNDEAFANAFQELLGKLNQTLQAQDQNPLALHTIPLEEKPKLSVSKQYVAAAYGEELVALAAEHPEIIVLDGDLSADCKLRGFEQQFPGRFIENGIAEQDMVSMAGGLARQGLLPVVNTFSSFLAARANEQIYNNACEGTKIIYAAHFAGMLPAGPGKSHQSVRDIGLFAALPNMLIIQPATLEEARSALRFCVKEAATNCMLRMNIGPSPRELRLPDDYQFTFGRGATLRTGADAVLFAYGPVMLHEALLASESLHAADFGLQVVNCPWLNRFDLDWLQSVISDHDHLYVLDDHMLAGGFGDRLLDFLVAQRVLGERRFHRFGLHELPACGTPSEVLRHHKLDGHSLAEEILRLQGRRNTLAPAGTTTFNTLEAAQ